MRSSCSLLLMLVVAVLGDVACSSGNTGHFDADLDEDALSTLDSTENGDVESLNEDISSEEDTLLPEADIFTPQEEFPGEGYPSPEPDTCAFVGANCGEVLLAPGNILFCGECILPDTCGGGGTPNVCGHPICDEGWCWEHPYPQGDTLNDIYALDATHVWAVGDAVALFFNGTSWDRIPHQLRQGGKIQAIYAADPDHVWAVATDGCLLFLKEGTLSCNKGVDENSMPIYWSENRKALYAIHGTGPNDIWATGNGVILHWDGESWVAHEEMSGKIYAVYALSANSVWFGGEQGLFRYDGTTIIPVMTEVVIRDLAAFPSGDLWAVGDAGFISRYDGTTGATIVPPVEDRSYAAVVATSAGHLFVADNAGKLWRRLGEEWLAQPVALEGAIRSASGIGERIWFAGDFGFIASWDTKFFTVNRQRIPGGVRALFATSPFDVWAAGDRFFARWDGRQWQFMASRRDITDLYGAAYNDIYAETASGEFLHYDGTRWSTALPDEETVATLKAARDAHLDRPDEKTIRWCFNEAECWSFASNLFIQDTPTRRYASYEWPFEGLWYLPPEPSGNTNACATSDGRYWATNGIRTILYEEGRWYHLDFSSLAHAATTVACEGNDVYFADLEGIIWCLRDGSTKENIGLIEKGEAQIIDLSAEGTLYVMVESSAGFGKGKLYRIENGVGVEMEIPDDAPVLSFAAISDDDLWVASSNALYHWDGNQWTVTLPADLTDKGLPPGETEVYFTRIFALDSNNIWMTGRSPDATTAYIFSYDGTKWVGDARSTLSGTLTFTDIWATDQQNAYLPLSTQGWIYHYKSLGSTGMIDSVAAPAATPFFAMAGRAGEEMRVFGPNGVILRKDF